ncbi:MAG: hemolysin family protein [Candidatus Dormibacteria bacterium]
MDGGNQLYVLTLVVALAVSLFASSAETALTSVSRVRVQHLAQEGQLWARRLSRMHADPNTFLSTILVLNTLAVAGAAVAADRLAENYGHINPLIVSFAVALVILLVAELAPKTFAVARAEQVARVLTAPVHGLSRAMSPLVRVLGATTGLMLRPFHLGKVRPGPFVSQDELRLLLNLSEEQGVLEEEEVETIHRIFEIGDKLVREIMIPRTDVLAVENTATLDDLLDVILDKGHTRIPVYEESLDSIVGIVYAKDMLRYLGREHHNEFDIRQVLRPVRFVPETRKVDELLHDMQREHVHLVVIVDEYGGTSGICTIEDVLEEIVGEIEDEYDRPEEEDVQRVNDRELLLNARIGIDELNDLLGLELEPEHFDTLGGLVVSELGHIPKPGDTLTVSGVVFTVESASDQRVEKVRARLPEADRSRADTEA